MIDASGSMAGEPLAAAKSATIRVVNSLGASDRLSIVSFASDVQVHANGMSADQAGRTSMVRAVMHMKARGSTNMAAGWLAGCECAAQVLERTDGASRNHVILLSDGYANQGECDPRVLERHAHELRRRGVLTSTIGVGEHYSPVQLQAIAEAGGGRMHDAELSEEIAEIVFAELNDAGRTAVHNLETDVSLPPGVEVEAYGSAPSSRMGGTFTALLGSVLAGATRRLVLKVTFPKGRCGDRAVVEVATRWNWPGEQATQRGGTTRVEVAYADEAACGRQDRDEATAMIVAEQWRAHVMRRAMMLNQEGRLHEAKDYVMAELKWFERYCKGLPNAEALVPTMSEYAPRFEFAMGAMAAKEVLLASHKLIRGEEDHRSRRRDGF